MYMKVKCWFSKRLFYGYMHMWLYKGLLQSGGYVYNLLYILFNGRVIIRLLDYLSVNITIG